ncbi:hypothetical protein SEA_KRILI_128 [Mycobacterium phage Krili]|nr:hypothetical protein SEA_KRILI_128 [Mycobacterium phage Krili]
MCVRCAVHACVHSRVRFACLLCVCARRDLTCAYAFLFDFARVRDARDRCPCLRPVLCPCLCPRLTSMSARVCIHVCARVRVPRIAHVYVPAFGPLDCSVSEHPVGMFTAATYHLPPPAHVCVPAFGPLGPVMRTVRFPNTTSPRRCVIPLDISPCQE